MTARRKQQLAHDYEVARIDGNYLAQRYIHAAMAGDEATRELLAIVTGLIESLNDHLYPSDEDEDAWRDRRARDIERSCAASAAVRAFEEA
jgi:hypothetical protein